MNFIRTYMARRSARRLSLIGHDKRHKQIIDRARQMRVELNMPPSQAFERV